MAARSSACRAARSFSASSSASRFSAPISSSKASSSRSVRRSWSESANAASRSWSVLRSARSCSPAAAGRWSSRSRPRCGRGLRPGCRRSRCTSRQLRRPAALRHSSTPADPRPSVPRSRRLPSRVRGTPAAACACGATPGAESACSPVQWPRRLCVPAPPAACGRWRRGSSRLSAPFPHRATAGRTRARRLLFPTLRSGPRRPGTSPRSGPALSGEGFGSSTSSKNLRNRSCVHSGGSPSRASRSRTSTGWTCNGVAVSRTSPSVLFEMPWSNLSIALGRCLPWLLPTSRRRA